MKKYLGNAFCVNALQRATLISTKRRTDNVRKDKCVNALQRATLISTRNSWKAGLRLGGCQCPPTGNTHFHCNKRVNGYLRERVNALQRATLISTLIRPSRSQCSSCVNALQRATLISTLWQRQATGAALLCQCPPTGNTHFHLKKVRNDFAAYNVSMPSNGQHSFPLRIVLLLVARSMLCQCPPTGNTHFHKEVAK